MGPASWLDDTRTSYDAVADGYADLFRDGLDGHPQVRAVLALFVELVRDVGGPVLDVGCGTGLLTGQLRDRLNGGQGGGQSREVEVFGVDLSPGMLAIARRDHPDLRFEVGSMTDLEVPDSSVGGLLAFYSVIHVPDEEVPTVFAHVHRVLRPGGVAMIGFHVGDGRHHKTEGYGGRPMNLDVHLRPVDRMAGWLGDAGLTVETQILVAPGDPVPGGSLLARRPAPGPAGRSGPPAATRPGG